MDNNEVKTKFKEVFPDAGINTIRFTDKYTIIESDLTNITLSEIVSLSEKFVTPMVFIIADQVDGMYEDSVESRLTIKIKIT